jgi:flagellar motor switch protein FliG
MELGKGGVPGNIDPGAPLMMGGAAGGGQIMGGESAPREDREEVVFNIRVEQVPFLVNLMVSEAPSNVALVAGHLPLEVQREFLKSLPSAVASEIIINMAEMRFVEPEIITTLKDELERRLSGAVGGIDGALSAIENVTLRAKRGMLVELEQKHPALAAEIRKRILMPDDLALLAEKDLSLMVSAFKVEEWASALFELPEAVKLKLKGQMAEKTWQMIEQSMSYGTPSSEKTEEALELIMTKVAVMIKEGRIRNPLEGTRLISSEESVA